MPDEFWLTQAQWHEEVWETRNFLGSFSLPHPFFHHKDGFFPVVYFLLRCTLSDSVLDFEVQEFLWSSLPYKKTFYMLNIYMFQYNITLWNPCLFLRIRVTRESLHSRFHYLLFFIDLANTSI